MAKRHRDPQPKDRDTPPSALEYSCDKILAEQALASRSKLPATILRLPKVYGAEDNANLATIYAFRHAPRWKWTHAHVENVAYAITLGILDDRAAGRAYNVGEATTPTMAERLALLPPNPTIPNALGSYNFVQNIELDTSRIRQELGYVDEIDETRAMNELVRATANPLEISLRDEGPGIQKAPQ